MVFSSEKKELWRYASRNNVNCSVGVGNNRPQQLLRHQHLHRLQSPPPDYYATTTSTTTTTRKLIQQQEPQLQPPAAAAAAAGATTTTRRNITTVNTTCLTDDNRLNQQQLQQQQQQLEEEHNMPPPPYSSVPCGIDCSDTCQQRRRRLSTTSSNCGNYDGGLEEMDGGGSGSISGSGSVDRYSIGGISYIDGKSAFTCASVSSSRSISSLGKNKNNNNNSNNNMERNEHDWKLYNNNYDNEENAIVVATTTSGTSTTTTTTTSTTSSTIPIVTSTASVLAATAASIFRNCCGGNIGGGDGVLENANQSSNSLTITSTTSNNNNKNNKHSILLAKNCNTTTTTACFTRRQYFDAFIKHLKEGQVTVLLKAVKSRLDPISSLTALYQQRKQQQQQHQQNQHQHQQYAPYCCILVHRALIMNEELHVIACRLFFWPELKDASELKCLPDCPNHCDPMYICCNPLHWCRIFKAETAPPPYQLNSNTCDKMQYNDTTILENGRSQNIENNVPPTRQNYLLANENIVQNLCVQIPESVATAGEDAQACSLIWCQLAYWELRQRVGPLYMAKKSCVNVYTDTPQHDALSEGMCLKDLSAINTSNIRNDTVSEDVQYTRKKIGLGVTLSQESDGVWLYNRSRVPIFLHSPTLSESWFRVCKISPGECVKAFDTHRAHSLYTLPYDGSHMGRVDTFSMRLSFAKGWGCNYKRQDITRCPCWLEVFFTQR